MAAITDDSDKQQAQVVRRVLRAQKLLKKDEEPPQTSSRAPRWRAAGELSRWEHLSCHRYRTPECHCSSAHTTDESRADYVCMQRPPGPHLQLPVVFRDIQYHEASPKAIPLLLLLVGGGWRASIAEDPLAPVRIEPRAVGLINRMGVVLGWRAYSFSGLSTLSWEGCRRPPSCSPVCASCLAPKRVCCAGCYEKPVR
jgi:hypothetical protein